MRANMCGKHFSNAGFASTHHTDENNWFFKFAVGFGYYVFFLLGHITLSSFAEFSRPLKYYHKSCSILMCHAHALIGGHHCADCGDMKIELI